MRIILKRVIIILLTILLLGLIGTLILFHDEIGIIGSIEKNKDGNFYEMTYTTDYHMDELLMKGAKSDGELANILSEYISHGFYKPDDVYSTEIGCSTIAALTSDGKLLWGRNFDWDQSTPIIVKSIPKEGYKSISTCEFGNITDDPTLDSIGNKFLAIAAYYVPMDGINEKGLCVADLEVNEGGMRTQDTAKADITITMAIRLLLNRAATVDEAVNLLNKYDIYASGGISHHLSVADATGRSVSIEFMDGETVVVETPCVTNFNLANGSIDAGGDSARDRYLILKDILEKSGAVLDKAQIKDALFKVMKPEGQWSTRWSIIYQYDEERIYADYYFNGDFEKKYAIEVGQ